MQSSPIPPHSQDRSGEEPQARSPSLAAATGRDLTVSQRDITEIPLNKQQIIDGPISQLEGGDKSRGLAPRRCGGITLLAQKFPAQLFARIFCG